ncbi:hypothetical protein [Roseibium sp. SCP14]|uniref:hypothetical protein n=1 Tax=Roseibium sp. SCP14 TaxID=3141375 RepID=UPI003335BEE8
MARFPFHKSNIRELGRLLAKASLDEKIMASLQNDPASCLEQIGLPAQTTKLMTFNVIDQKQHPNAKALPYRLNTRKLRSGDRAYLRELSQSFGLN